MAIVLGDTSGLARGIEVAGSALGQAMQQHGALKRQEELKRQRSEALKGSLSRVLEKTTDPMQRTMLESVMESIDIAPGQPEISETLLQQFGGIGNIANLENTANMFSSEFGYAPDEAMEKARAFSMMNTGTKTLYMQQLIEDKQRGQGEFKNPPMTESFKDEMREASGEYEYPQLDIFEGFTPKEKAKEQMTLRKENAETFGTLAKQDRSLKKEGMSLNQLKKLNEGGKLPKGMQRLNVDFDTGKLLFPAGASPEAQLFVKIVNDFTTKAKESYGARVTNFELDRFLLRLPSLANTQDGRTLILEQMQTVNELDQLHSESLKKVYQKYGLKNIDSMNAERIAEDLRRDKEEDLMQRFNNVTEILENEELRIRKPEGKVAMQLPDGRKGYFPEENVQNVLDLGGKRL